MPETSYYEKRKARGERALTMYANKEDLSLMGQAAAIQGFTTLAAWARETLTEAARKIVEKEKKKKGVDDAQESA